MGGGKHGGGFFVVLKGDERKTEAILQAHMSKAAA